MKKRVAGLVAMSIATTPVSLRPAAAAAGSVHARTDLDPHKGSVPQQQVYRRRLDTEHGSSGQPAAGLRRAPVGLLRHRCPERAGRVQS